MQQNDTQKPGADHTPAIDLAAIKARADAATEGPWFYNSYSGIFTAHRLLEFDDWMDPLVDGGHTLERGGTCPACTSAKGCAIAREVYDREPIVAHVPAWAGDTAVGRRCADAEFIAAARTDVPALLAAVAELERQRDEARAEAKTLRGERNWLLADLDAEGRHRFHLLAQTAERARAERVLPVSVGQTFGNALAEMGACRTRRPNPPGPIELDADEQLCTDKNGFHDPHDWQADPCDDLVRCPGYPVPRRAAATSGPPDLEAHDFDTYAEPDPFTHRMTEWRDAGQHAGQAGQGDETP